MSYSPWGPKESDTTERLSLSLTEVCSDTKAASVRGRSHACLRAGADRPESGRQAKGTARGLGARLLAGMMGQPWWELVGHRASGCGLSGLGSEDA